MADTPVTQSLLVLETTFRSDIVSQINRQSVLLRMLPNKLAEAQYPTWPARYSGAVAENYTEGADASDFGSDAQSQALLGWGFLRSNFHISGTAQRVSGVIATPAANQNQIRLRTLEASEALTSRINGQLYSGSSSTQIIGLAAAIGSDSNTYAGIDRSNSTYAFWRPKVIDPGVLTKPTLPLIRKDLADIYSQSGFSPNMAVCSPGVFTAIAESFDSTRHYIQDVMTPRGIVRLDGSARAIDVDGCVFVRDKDCTANTIYYLNTDYIDIEVLPPPPAFQQFVQNAGIALQADDGFGVLPLGFELHYLSKAGDSDKFELVTNLQLRVRKPHAFGCRKNVQTL